MAFAKIPSRWIRDGRLARVTWHSDKGAATAALLIIMAMAIHRNRQAAESGDVAAREFVEITFDDLDDLTGISRSLIARGLSILIRHDVVRRSREHRSIYCLAGVATTGEWCALPQSALTHRKRMHAFDWVNLRRQAYLDALKIYLLMLALRNNKTGHTHVGFDKISEYTGVAAGNVRRAKSLLIANGLLHAESDPDSSRIDAGRPPLRYTVRGF